MFLGILQIPKGMQIKTCGFTNGCNRVNLNINKSVIKLGGICCIFIYRGLNIMKYT